MLDEALVFTTPAALGGLGSWGRWLVAALSSSCRIIIVVIVIKECVCVHVRVCVSDLGQVCEPPLRYDRSPPQVVDADVVGGRGHGGFQVVVVAERTSGHSDWQPHPTHPRALDGCGAKTQFLAVTRCVAMVTKALCHILQYRLMFKGAWPNNRQIKPIVWRHYSVTNSCFCS